MIFNICPYPKWYVENQFEPFRVWANKLIFRNKIKNMNFKQVLQCVADDGFILVYHHLPRLHKSFVAYPKKIQTTYMAGYINFSLYSCLCLQSNFFHF